VDLVREQIRIAAGEPVGYDQAGLTFRGCAIEARVNAEDPAREFRPAPGTIAVYREPAGFGVRVDSAAYAGWTIPAEYDSLIAKLVVWAPDREAAIARLRRAIGEYAIEGVPTTLALLQALCDHPAVIDATYGTATLEAFARTWQPPPPKPAVSAQPLAAHRRTAPRLGSLGRGASASGGDAVLSPMHGVVVELRARKGDRVNEGEIVAVVEAMKMMNEIRAHRGGTVTIVHARCGSSVESGSPLLTLG
jgi:acetyl-CoA/propionyl-CoA carboxylase biotin carboxyl carrier protein